MKVKRLQKLYDKLYILYRNEDLTSDEEAKFVEVFDILDTLINEKNEEEKKGGKK